MRHQCSVVTSRDWGTGKRRLETYALRSRVLFIVLCSKAYGLVNFVSLRTQPVMPVVLC